MAPRQYDLQAYLRHWLSTGPKPTKGLRLQVDIDPQHFL
jgi:primosomal protein N' (replication factor Y)